jgi:hypothetical protein
MLAMPRDLAIRCSCGALQGLARDVSPEAGNHVVCYCDDCQAFAHFLGRPTDILDQHGGTEIFQMSQAALILNAGAERLACMRLTVRGLFRWYASCCNTPIGNTLATSKIPFIGLIHRCIEKPPDDTFLEKSLGPIRARVFQQFGIGDRAALPAGTPLPMVMLRFGRLALRWRLRGDHKHSFFFDPRAGHPIVAPRVLTVAERDELRGVV